MPGEVQGTQLTPLGRWLKRLRAQNDLTQEALAERVNVSVQTIRFFESGRRRPSWETAELLADALHVPEQEREAFIRIARQPAASAEAEPAEPVSAPATPAGSPSPRLPRPLTPLVGRAAECRLLETLLMEERRPLVTLVGTGGMGKTRLALHMAHWLAPRFPDGAAFVALSSVQHSGEMPSAIARALGAPLAGDSAAVEQLDVLLAGQSLLLVLDNFEHLLAGGDAAVALISHVVEHSPGVQLLVTSTERLRISAESIVELGGLGSEAAGGDTPAPSDAVLLYAERARQVAPDFTLTPENRVAVERICRLLEGMPLGVELAASWARMLSAQEIADEIAHSLDFLTLADRSAPARHRSLRAVFEHTWRLMMPEEQRILPRLAVFRGGFDRAAALEVTGTTLVQIAGFIDKSVLRVAEETRGSGASAVRYSLHGLLRQFLHEKLEQEGDLDAMRRAHARYFVEVAERGYPNLFGTEAARWQRQLDREQQNFQAALTWSLAEAHDACIGLRLAGSLSRLWRLEGAWRSGRSWLEQALARAAGEPAERARALVGLGDLCQALSDHASAERHLRAGLALWEQVGEQRWLAWTHFQLGMLASAQGHPAEALAELDTARDLYRQLGDEWGVATVLNQLGSVAITTGDYARAGAYLNDAIALMRGLGGRRTGLAVSLNALGRIVLAEGDVSRAVALFEEALDIFAERNVREGLAWSNINLGLAGLQAGDLRAAVRSLRLCLNLYVDLDMIVGITASLNGLAALAAAQGNLVDAARLAGAVARLCQEHDCHLTEFERAIAYATLEAARAAVPLAELDGLVVEGAKLTLSGAVALGRTVART